jgi:hypothetical protein
LRFAQLFELLLELSWLILDKLGILYTGITLVKYSMAITNLKELISAISSTAPNTTVVARGIDTGSLRLNPLALTLTNINAATSAVVTQPGNPAKK